jgi:hypothetical protein
MRAVSRLGMSGAGIQCLVANLQAKYYRPAVPGLALS